MHILFMIIGILLCSPLFLALWMIAVPILAFYFWGFEPVPFLVIIILDAIIFFGFFLDAVDSKYKLGRYTS